MSEIFERTQKPRIAAVVGCTASGKTALSVELARRFGGEIVSCDSMQIYQEMNIGTAKPDAEERRGIVHHLMDFVNPRDPRGYSCADYVQDARAAVADILARGKLPILCGGTGLYLDAFLRGGSFEVSDTDPALREELMELARRDGADALHALLRELDPEAAAATHPNNVKRVARAIEICRTTGKTKSELDRASQDADSPYDALVIGLDYRNRNLLYDRINRRADAMMEAGLLEETRALRAMGVFDLCPTAAQAIGYKEFFPYLDGTAPLDACVEVLKTATRRYAKRQMTWFRAKSYVTWVPCDAPVETSAGASDEPSESHGASVGTYGMRNFEDIVNNVEKLFHKYGFCGIL